MSKRRNHTSREQMRWVNGLIDSGSSISFLSWSTNEKLGKPGIVQTYVKRVLTANNSAVKIIGRVTLLVQLQPRLPEVEQEFVITAAKV